MKLTVARTLKITLLTLVCVLALCALPILVPEVWLKTSVMARLIPWVLHEQGIDATWDRIHFETDRIAWNRLRLKIVFEDLKLAPVVQGPNDGGVDAAVEVLDLVADIDWYRLPPRIERIENLILKTSSIRLLPSASANEPMQSSGTWTLPDLQTSRQVPAILAQTSLGHIDIRADKIVIESQSPDSNTTLQVRAFTDQSNFTAEVHEHSRQWDGVATLELDANRHPNFSRMQVKAEAWISKTDRVSAELVSRDIEDNKTALDGKATYKSIAPGKRSAELKFTSVIGEKDVELKVEGAVLQIHPWLPRLASHEPCVGSLTSNGESHMTASFRCNLRAVLNIPPIVGVPSIRLPTHSDIDLAVNAHLRDVSDRLEYSGEVSLDSQQLISPLLTSALNLKSSYRGILGEGMSGFHQNTQVEADVSMARFENAVKMLSETRWAVPAPLNNLSGPLSLKLRSQWEDWHSQSPIALETSLQSNEQSFKITALGSVDFVLKPELDIKLTANVELDDVRISVPRLDKREIPRFFRDTHIRSQDDAGGSRESRESPVQDPSEKGVALAYDISIRTPVGRPLLIDSNLFPEPLAFDIEGRLSSEEATTFSIHTYPTSFEIFRRKSNLDSVDIDIIGDEIRIDGRARMQSGEYTVKAHFYGPIDRIRVQLQSDPEVREEELWAIILFGEPMNSLDIEDQNSANSTQRMFAKGGMNLLSLYAFASTPIETVGYDPATQRISVRFRVPGGTTLELARSEDEVGSLGIRKKIGNGWAIKARVGKGDLSKSSSTLAGAFLEWSKRY